MNATMRNLSNRLSLRAPQRESLAALVKSIEATHGEMLQSGRDVAAMLETLKKEFPTLKSFERDFPSLCFARATGVGKTRLMDDTEARSFRWIAAGQALPKKLV